jgi:hypothetical protein
LQFSLEGIIEKNLQNVLLLSTEREVVTRH